VAPTDRMRDRQHAGVPERLDRARTRRDSAASNSTLAEGGWVKEGRRDGDHETARRTGVIVTIRWDSVKQERQARLFARECCHCLRQDSQSRRNINGSLACRTDEERSRFMPLTAGPLPPTSHCAMGLP
jgi:hypothetical protein